MSTSLETNVFLDGDGDWQQPAGASVGRVVVVSTNGDGEEEEQTEKYKFALVPKQTSSPFFSVVEQGCKHQARKLGNVECIYTGTEFVDVEGQAQLIRDLVASGIDGIAIANSVSNAVATIEAIDFAIDAGVPVITFDSDTQHSKRLTYIGTDNYAFGAALGKVLLQIDPTGGYYGVITTDAGNAVERERGLRDRLVGSNWIEHHSSPGNCEESDILAIEKMGEMAAFSELKAIIPLGGWPMRNTTRWEEVIDVHPNLTTVGADTLPHQMDLVNRGYVTGLVGQVPFQMGTKAMDVLLAHVRGESTPKEVFGTSLQEVITVPLDLPDADVNMHHIGNLKYLGFVCCGIVTLLSVGFALWVYLLRKRHVVRASQPSFLIMIAVGTTILGGSMIPLSFDDGTAILNTKNTGVVACMSPIWLVSVGFTTVFSALFSKTWRINKIFHNPSRFSRVTVTNRDVIYPFLVLLSANVLTLSLFTALAPLEFVRQAHAGTDDWNRVISTYGMCSSTTDRWGGAIPYYVTLVVINFGVLVVANFQAYQARSIQSEFSESHYIAVVNASMLQVFFTSVPILFLVREIPETSYVLKVCMIFIICIVILLCIFVPKLFSLQKRTRMSAQRASSSSVFLPASSRPRVARQERRPGGTAGSQELRLSYDDKLWCERPERCDDGSTSTLEQPRVQHNTRLDVSRSSPTSGVILDAQQNLHGETPSPFIIAM